MAYSVNSIWRIAIQQTHTAYTNQLNTAYLSTDTVADPKIEFCGQFLKEFRDNTFSGLEHEDANEHVEKVLEIIELFHVLNITQDQLMLRAFPVSLTGSASRWLRNEPAGSFTTREVLKMKFLSKYCPPACTAKKIEEINNFQQEPDESLFCAWERFKELLMKCPQHYLTDMQEVFLFYNGLDVPTRPILDSKGKWHNETFSRNRSTETSDGLAAIQAQLNNLGREIKKVNEKVYAAQVGCEQCKGPHYKKDCPLKEEGKTLEEAYYSQFGAPYQPRGQYRAAMPGFYQHNNRNSSCPPRRDTMEESLSKFIAASAKRYKENSNIIKEIRASTDAAIRNQGASIKTLELQFRQMSKVLQERGFGSLSSSTETTPRDQVTSISTATADLSKIRHMEYGPYAVSEARGVKILEAYDHTLPQKEKDTGSFTLPCFINNACFDKALVDLGASDESLDLLYGNYVELNNLDVPLKPMISQDAEPTFVNKPTSEYCYEMKFSSVIGYKHINASLFPTLSINLMTKRFYDSINKDEGDHKRERIVGTLIDIPIFVREFSVVLGFTIIDNLDADNDVVLNMPFFKKYMTCQKVMEKFAHGDEYERIVDE
ncbi:hypothetical protein Tco_0221350 [Tanacetum coccineum]